MARRISLFEGYYRRREIDALKHEFDEFHGLVRQLLDDTVREQASRRRTIRGSGPWDAEWEVAGRNQTQRAQVVLARMRQVRRHQVRIRELEAQLPPNRGWRRLRYANPWFVNGAMAGVLVTISVLNWIIILLPG